MQSESYGATSTPSVEIDQINFGTVMAGNDGQAESAICSANNTHSDMAVAGATRACAFQMADVDAGMTARTRAVDDSRTISSLSRFV